MSSPIPISQINQIMRPTAEYSPSLCGHHFLSCSSQLKNGELQIQKRLQHLKEEVRKLLLARVEDSLEKLYLIDAIQRLGVSHHFESEIQEILQHMQMNPPSSDGREVDADLRAIALWFRLLRQQGYDVSCGIFDKFKDDNGDFKISLIDNVPGMLSLYEAADMGIHGESVLDQALSFTTYHLESRLSGMSPHLTEKVVHALNRPIHKALPRLEARYYMSMYSKDDSRNDLLLEFAKLDFNVIQAQHRKELSHVTQWWKKLNFLTNVPYARDRVVKVYFWPLNIYFQPQYATGRIIVGKLCAVLSAIGDTYDAFATIDELQLFSQAVQRWDSSSLDSVPQSMKAVFQALVELFSEMELLTAEEGRSCFVQYVRETVQKLVQAFMVESKWREMDYTPTFDEYMDNGIVTSCYPVLETASFLGLGNIATKEVFDWISNVPKIVRASSIICRIANDMASHKFEQKRVHLASAVECCMKQYGISEEKAYELLHKELESAWKDINEECLKLINVLPMPVLECVTNFSRIIELVYENYADKYTNSELLKDHIAALVENPMPI